jgi:ABC-type amino acid transport substrate-binding protein
MKFSQIILVLILCIAAAYATATYVSKPTAAPTTAKETAYQRVMRTGVLRCGYIIYPQFLERDPNTGAFGGVVYELMEEIVHQLSLKIEWTEEVGMSNMFEGLSIGRYDAMCSMIAYVPNRLRGAEFTDPYLYFPLYAYARADDTRFDNNLAKINDPSIKIAYLEGEMGQTVKEQDFPNAASVSLQNLTGFSDVPLQVATGKADIAMGEPAEMDAFMAKNPGKIHQISGPPVRMQASALQVATGEESLKSLLNGTLLSLQNTGFIAHLLEKRIGAPGHYYFLPQTAWRENN